MLELGITADNSDTSFLVSEDEEEDDIFVTTAPAEKPKLLPWRGVSSPAPSLHVDLLNMCKRAAEKLEVPWSVVW